MKTTSHASWHFGGTLDSDVPLFAETFGVKSYSSSRLVSGWDHISIYQLWPFATSQQEDTCSSWWEVKTEMLQQTPFIGGTWWPSVCSFGGISSSNIPLVWSDLTVLSKSSRRKRWCRMICELRHWRSSGTAGICSCRLVMDQLRHPSDQEMVCILVHR